MDTCGQKLVEHFGLLKKTEEIFLHNFLKNCLKKPGAALFNKFRNFFSGRAIAIRSYRRVLCHQK